jgi:hypothetical protein
MSRTTLLQGCLGGDCIALYSAKSIFRCAATVENRDRQTIFGNFRLYPAIVSGLMFFAGFWVIFGSLDMADDLA